MRPSIVRTATLAVALGISGAVLVALGACSSTPASHYALNSIASGAPAAGPALSVAVGPVLIPALVDRPQMVFDKGANQVSIDEFKRWAAPLADEIGRVTIGNLGQLLGNAEVGPASAGAAARAQVKVGLDVIEFRSVPGSEVWIDVRWNVRRGEQQRSGQARLREKADDAGGDAIAAAHSRALARMAADIAVAIRAM